jgi:hypothetical protein
MATPLSNAARGLPDESCGCCGCGGTRAGAGRATHARGVPPARPPEQSDRYVTYRFEDSVPEAPQSARRKIYPYWAPVQIQRGNVAPERIDVGNGIVAVKAEPDREPALSPPPLISAPPPPPPRQEKKKTKAEAEAPAPPPAPPGPIVCGPGYKPTKSGKACIETDERAQEREKTERNQELRRAIRDYSDATFDEGFENAKKVAKLAGTIIPGPAGRGFKIAEKIFEGVHDAYVGAKLIEELVTEMNQSDAMAKGGKELLKKGEDEFEKSADPFLDKILKRRGITLPKEVRKFVIKKAREYFDKHLRDPAIQRGKEEFEKRMDPNERDKSLWDEWSRGLPFVR